jgi:hypothetical protein
MSRLSNDWKRGWPNHYRKIISQGPETSFHADAQSPPTAFFYQNNPCVAKGYAGQV